MTFVQSVLLLSLIAAATLVADEGTTFFRNPALSATTIVFEYGGDLWTVPRSGGQAARLTAGPGEETNPVFSPDGSMVAFSGRYDGNVDVFVVPASGGVPKTADVAPRSRCGAGLDARRQARALQLGPFGGARPLSAAVHDRARRRPRAAAAAAHRIRRRILARRRAHRLCARCSAHSRCGSDTAAAGRRRSGWLIWRPRVSRRCRGTTRTTTGRCGPPARSGFSRTAKVRVTLFSYDPRPRRVTRAVENRGIDFKSASAGTDAIVIEQFGGLHLYDLKSGTARRGEHQRFRRSSKKSASVS